MLSLNWYLLRRVKKGMLLLAICCPFYIEILLAKQLNTDSVRTETLKEVLVKADIKSIKLTSPTPVQILKGDELKRLNSFSVADAVRYFSGVQIKDYGGIGGLKTINVRGMGTNHTAVFYDGMLLNNAQNGQVDLGRFSLDNLEEITLYNGQKPEISLPARAFASASSVYLKTSVPVFSADKSQNYKIGFRIGSFGLLNPILSFQQKISSKIKFSFNTDYMQADGKYKFRYADYNYDTTAVRQNGDIKSNRVEAALFGTTRDSSVWQVKLYQYNSERGLPGAIVSEKLNFSQRQADDDFFVQTSLENNRNKRYSYIFNAKYAYNFLRYTDPKYVLNNALVNTYRQQEYYFSFANKYKLLPVLDIALSGDYSYQNLDANLLDFAYPTRQTGLVVISSSYKKRNITLHANVLTTLLAESVKVGTVSNIKPQYNPSILFSWQPDFINDFSVRAFYKSIFRMPSFNDLYYTLIGNTDLKPEDTEQYNLGFSKWISPTGKSLKYFEMKADVYYNDITNKIVAVPSLNLFRWSMMNLDRVKVRGVEFSTNTVWRLGKDLSLNSTFNYTYEKALDYSPNGFNYREQIPYVPVHSGTARFALLYKNYTLNYAYIYTGERYSQKENIAKNYLQPWYTHDVALSANFNLKQQQKLEIGVELNNILNQYYDVILNYPMPGVNYKINCNLRF